jgi:TonB family protein
MNTAGTLRPLATVALCLALAACAAGIVPARPVAPLASLITADDWPTGLERDPRPVTVMLEIGPDGRVAACRVTRSSGAGEIDRVTCRRLQSRARFTPARNARGAAMADRYRVTVRWVLPDD